MSRRVLAHAPSVVPAGQMEGGPPARVVRRVDVGAVPQRPAPARARPVPGAADDALASSGCRPGPRADVEQPPQRPLITFPRGRARHPGAGPGGRLVLPPGGLCGRRCAPRGRDGPARSTRQRKEPCPAADFGGGYGVLLVSVYRISPASASHQPPRCVQGCCSRRRKSLLRRLSRSAGTRSLAGTEKRIQPEKENSPKLRAN